MKESNKKGLIALAAIGAASAALGFYLSKKENREKIKKGIDSTSEILKNKIDELDYRYNIIPCDEVYQWNKEDDNVTISINKKAKSFEDDV